MANFGGRRAPNVSQYVANLNTIPSEIDIAAQQEENFSLTDDLAIFTNAEFYDFDLGVRADETSARYDASQEAHLKKENAVAAENGAKGLVFVNGDYAFPEIEPILPLNATNPAEYNPSASYAAPQGLPQPNLPNPYNTTITSPFNAISYPDNKRQATSPAVSTFEEDSHKAADEDKRRRNTAASARFRVKKKQREQALERTTKDLTDKANALQSRIGQLETENAWLRKLVIEKNGEESLKEQHGGSSREEARIAGGGKEGVGTGGM